MSDSKAVDSTSLFDASHSSVPLTTDRLEPVITESQTSSFESIDLAFEVQQYIQILRELQAEHSDGAWIGNLKHQQLFSELMRTIQVVDSLKPLCEGIEKLLSTEPNLALRYEALRLASQTPIKKQMRPVLLRCIERAGFYPLIGRRIHTLLRRWTHQEPPATNGLPLHIEKLRADVHRALWFSAPQTSEEPIRSALEQLSEYGELGLFATARLLREQLQERELVTHATLTLFRIAAELFIEHNYFEGVQVFFDFLAECRPIRPDIFTQKTVGAVLTAVRLLRPYRYPQWAVPLRRFVEHYRSIGHVEHAEEASRLIASLTTSSLGEILLLQSDELVDLIQGRRDAAQTDEALLHVAELCDGILESQSSNARIVHIRGWLAARLEGVDAAEPFFKMALELQPDYVYSHLALSAIYDQWGLDELQEYHLQRACDSKFTLISCQRKYGELLQRNELFEDAECYYLRGTQVQPDTASTLELEEFFGSYAALASLYVDFDLHQKALATLQKLEYSTLLERFGARFCLRQKVVVDLLLKGLRDFQSEIQRSAEYDPSA